MIKILSYLQLAISLFLIISVLMQNRGAGLSAAFGGNLGGFHTKRGLEKFLFFTSWTLGIAFIVNALLITFLSAQV